MGANLKTWPATARGIRLSKGELRERIFFQPALLFLGRAAGVGQPFTKKFLICDLRFPI
jgi:hypothetical protein